MGGSLTAADNFLQIILNFLLPHHGAASKGILWSYTLTTTWLSRLMSLSQTHERRSFHQNLF